MNWVVISAGSNQEMYVGKTDLTDFIMRDHVARGEMIELHECRLIRTILLPTGTGSVQQHSIVMPYSLNRGPAIVYVRPVSFMFPDDETAKLIEQQVKRSEENDVRHRAADAGLIVPDKAKQ
jgi:hypothetical protein